MLNDRKTVTKEAWQKIVEDLRRAGVGIPLGSVGISKAQAQWSAMTKKFKDYKDNAQTTGTGSVPKPEFYEELFSILGTITIVLQMFKQH